MTVLHTLRDLCPGHRGTCVALGMFDGLHLGHRAVIASAVETAQQEQLVSYVFTFSTRGARPVSKQEARRLLSPTLREQLLEEMGVERMLRPDFEEFRELSPAAFVEEILLDKLEARHVFCGENFRFGKHAAGGSGDLRRLCGERGVEVTVLPLVYREGRGVSSTRIRQCITQGDIPAANNLLGRRFAIDFDVIHGRHLGRKLNFPTINQPFPPDFVIPKFGVYATVSTVDGNRYPSVTNVGVKPTVGSDGILGETYIIGYHGDLYHRRILVEFLEFVREEMRFSSVEELREHIHRDSKTAESIVRNQIPSLR